MLQILKRLTNAGLSWCWNIRKCILTHCYYVQMQFRLMPQFLSIWTVSEHLPTLNIPCRCRKYFNILPNKDPTWWKRWKCFLTLCSNTISLDVAISIYWNCLGASSLHCTVYIDVANTSTFQQNRRVHNGEIVENVLKHVVTTTLENNFAWRRYLLYPTWNTFPALHIACM